MKLMRHIMKLTNIGKRSLMILLLGGLMAGCAGLRETLQTPEGQEATNSFLGFLDQASNLIPIPGFGLVDEILSVVLVIFGIKKTYRGLKNSKPGKLFGGEEPDAAK
jgi:hypothetical protein